MANETQARFLICGVALLGYLLTGQQPAVKAPSPRIESSAETKLLAETFYQLLQKNLPDPIVESKNGWGDQKEVTIGLKWERKGVIRFRPELMRDVKNDGHWQKVTVAAIDPDRTLTLKLWNVRTQEGKTTFDATVGLDVRTTYEQQMWAGGKRVYSGETRCKCRAELKLAVELTSKLTTKPGQLLPELSLRVRVTQAELSYDDLVCEHTLGVGGEAAKLMGKAAIEFIKKVKPDLEKELLAKANAAVVKAADTKEVRVEFDKLLMGKAAVSKGK
jgi:hypothetical protein